MKGFQDNFWLPSELEYWSSHLLLFEMEVPSNTQSDKTFYERTGAHYSVPYEEPTEVAK
jgi:hypothetical protein